MPASLRHPEYIERNAVRITMIIATAASLLAWQAAAATEPNENFESATLLGSGVLTVSDELRQPPDTLIGARDMFGGINEEYVNDDGGPFAATFGSEIVGVPTNSGAIRFAVTGVTGFPGDVGFVGDHGEAGRFEVFVEAFDFGGEPAGEFSEIRTLTPGAVEEFNFFDVNWISGSYNAYVNNVIDFEGFADVDFFTFTGLTPGAAFTAKTLDPTASNVDTFLGWFDATGTLLDDDDNGNGGTLSMLSGTVPGNGRVTLAVSGTEDLNFEGDHQAEGAYQLTLTLGGGGGFAADFNNDNKVNAADLAAWKTAFGATAVGDADNDSDSDGADFLIWQRQFGSGVTSVASASAVPEPTIVALLSSAVIGVTVLGRLRQPPR